MTVARKRQVWLSSGIIVMFLLGAVGSLLFPSGSNLNRVLTPAVVSFADRGCNPVGVPCAAQMATMSIVLELEQGLRPLKTFWVKVKLVGQTAAAVENVSVRFTMVGMDMGINRVSLRRQPNEIWVGQALLPVCSTGRRDWRASVEVAGNPPYIAEFSVQVDA